MTRPVGGELQKTLYWHDYETWGEIPAQDRPSQFAGVRTDEDLNIIGEPLMVYCRPAPDYLPKPEACLITGLTPQVALEKGVPEYQFIASIHAELSRPGTCGVGYNSIRFDDEVTRYTLYRNFYDPYEREWRNGNSRWDIIDMVRMTRALRPEGIEWPNYDDGRPCFKLEALTSANNLMHEAAHDALSDVYATIAMAKLIKERQPRLYDYAYRLRDKRFAAGLIDIAGGKPLLHISSRFPGEKGNAALMLPLAIHPANKNSVIAFNLESSPHDLLTLPLEELRRRLFSRSEELEEGVSRLALKEIHLNKSPMLLSLSMLDDETEQRLKIDRKVCEQHWRQFQGLTLIERERMQQTLFELFSESPFAERKDPDQMLYSGFFEDADRRLMQQVRSSSAQALAEKTFAFNDSRLPELLFRYRARNFPESLNPEEQTRWRMYCRDRLVLPEMGGGLVMEDLQQRIALLLADESTSPTQQEILKNLRVYADSLLVM